MRAAFDAHVRSASMRPQHITAENRQRDDTRPRPEMASMRPQHITAENNVAAFRTIAETAALQ